MVQKSFTLSPLRDAPAHTFIEGTIMCVVYAYVCACAWCVYVRGGCMCVGGCMHTWSKGVARESAKLLSFLVSTLQVFLSRTDNSKSQDIVSSAEPNTMSW